MWCSYYPDPVCPNVPQKTEGTINHLAFYNDPVTHLPETEVLHLSILLKIVIYKTQFQILKIFCENIFSIYFVKNLIIRGFNPKKKDSPKQKRDLSWSLNSTELPHPICVLCRQSPSTSSLYYQSVGLYGKKIKYTRAYTCAHTKGTPGKCAVRKSGRRHRHN